MKPKRIRPIAICLFRNGDRILVSDGVDPETGSPCCRPPGGSLVPEGLVALLRKRD